MKIIRNDNPVLIVGAGPVGMLTALELSLFGIETRIISKHPRYSPHSKATIIWPRVLEILSRTGVSNRIIETGHYFDQMNYYSNKKMIGNIRFDRLKYTNYRYGITIPQWKTERILEDRLNESGVFIEYGCEFIDGYNDNDVVNVTLQDNVGHIYHESYPWVIGADGYSSRVRECLGFGFDGYQMETRLAITDAELVSESTSREVGYYLHRSGNMVLAPIGDGLFRVGASVPTNYTGEINRQFFNKLLNDRVPGNKTLGHMNFCGIFNAHVRSASSYRSQNVFLVGDAAHVMSPSGAQGMNSGFQDAVNLSWKLAGVIRNEYDSSLLESYSTERMNGIKRTSKLSTFLANVSLYKKLPAIFTRDFAFRIVSRTGIVDRFITPRIAQIDIPHGELSEGITKLESGRRIPLEWNKSTLSPHLSLTKHTIFFWPGNHYIYSEWVKYFNSATKTVIGANLVNLSGKVLGFIKDLLPANSVCIIVRPDGFISDLVDINGISSNEVFNILNKKINQQPV
ncbi:FAD-dependent oxidoreductase [Xenorhabdus innexi]|uniref:2-octaprenyl-3-methyl-6-methoxy-1,4-benzoquinol hydroxylase n=1 Tax=Xenorhabdus innexi TaxID=290109 RepID=A0A1N6MUN1_9GAMM|nr:FAD-dependent monooxygenase [Xenorhabdus innexi]PHM30076.1 2-octaprenyl-3-methyl-6-methoxy-1,4-benzoquinol hydroxylase [Xenorhabdus innexi]SIP72497.1 putative Pentachlorophenol monooxygenase [Xenorhabdus innexi]